MSGAASVVTGQRRLRRTLVLLVVVPVVALAAIGYGYWRSAQAELATAYERADRAAAAGRYEEAIADFGAAGDYRDAATRRADLAAYLTPHRAAYEAGVAALDEGRFDEAIAALLPVARDLPTFRDAATRLAEARRLRATDLLRQADAAEARRDWLAADRALAELIAADPGDEQAADRLADLRRTHAPIALTRDGILYVIGPDEADERVVTDSVVAVAPIWNPDRTLISFLSHDLADPVRGADLYVVDPAGGEPVLVGQSVHPDAVPVWSPDGTKIAYTSVAYYDLLQNRGTLTIRVVDVTTGQVTEATRKLNRHTITPTWSPTGDRLAFVTRPANSGRLPTSGPGDIWVLDLESGTTTNLTRGRIPTVSRVLWSPASERLLAHTQRMSGVSAGTTDETRYFLLDATSGSLVDPLEDSDFDLVRGWYPTWSPDGTRFAFVEGNSTVVIQHIDGAPERYELDISLAGGVIWSPDSDAVIAVGMDPTAPSVLLPLDGSEPTPIVLVYTIGEWPAWSPVNPVEPPTAPAIEGTARDHAGTGAAAERERAAD